jgi:hypothetical protein
MCFKEGCLEVVDWINLAQNLDRWWLLLNVLMNFLVQKNVQNSLVS